MPILTRLNLCIDCSITVLRSFKSEWQHITNIWEGTPTLYHSILHFNLSLVILANCVLPKVIPIKPTYCSFPSKFSKTYSGKIGTSLRQRKRNMDII